MAQSESQNRKRLFDHLDAEFGDRGRDAVAFLETAQGLVAEDATRDLPRRAGAAAYCLREALKRLPPPESGRPLWRELSDQVLDAKKRFEAVRGLPGADEAGALEELLSTLGQLEEHKRSEQGQYQRRLEKLVEARTGTAPLRVTLREYQRLIREIDDNAVHATASIEHVRELLGRALALLGTVFAPFQLRRPELDALAQLPDPGEQDVQRLLSLCSTQHHLRYFLQLAASPRWLALLAPRGVLDPPAEGGVWPVLSAVEHLAPRHGPEIANWLQEMQATWGASEFGAAYVVAATRYCLPEASETLLLALRDYPRSQWIRAQATGALEKMGLTNSVTERVIDTLIDPKDELALAGIGRPAIQALVDGMTEDNVERRLSLLAQKLAASVTSRYLPALVTPSGLIEDASDEDRGTGVLLQGMIKGVQRARRIGLHTDRILQLFGPIPTMLLSRLRSWVLAEASDVPLERLVIEIADGIRGRSPSGDDVRLIDRVTNEAFPELYFQHWRNAIGPPPASGEVGKALASREAPTNWQRVRLWYPLLPEALRGDWNTTITLIAPSPHAPTREDYLRPPQTPELLVARSPMSKADLEGLEVAEAARRIASWRPTGDLIIVARQLARTLEELVSSSPRAWAEHPLEVVGILRHATYVHHYFEGLAKRGEELSGLGSQLVDAVTFAGTHPWEPIPLGDDDFDYDSTWGPADEAGVGLIGRLAERDVDLRDRYEDAWRIVFAAARDRSRGSSIISPREDPLETAINRPCTRALEAVFQLIGTEFRRSKRVRIEALDLLDETLDLEGWDGAEHRAVLAPRLAFLLHVAGGWVESRDAKLFGNEAPNGLGQRTVELAVKWGRPNRWLLEYHRRAVLRAVRAGADNALDHVVVAMLWQVPGYSIEQTFRTLSQMGALVVSNAGERLARVLMRDAEQQHVDRGVMFWKTTLENPSLPNEAFQGFGWWAEVDALDRDRWERMTLETSERAGGTLDWCVQVAERTTREPISTMGISILTSLLRGRLEPWDRYRVGELALAALKAPSGEPRSEERRRLSGALPDLGYFEAADF